MFQYLAYELALLLLAIVALPKMLFQLIFKGKYRNSLLQRFGLNFPHIDKKNKKLIWIHAVSVGETKAISALAKQLKKNFPDTLLLISNVTETGHAEALKTIDVAEYHVYLPFDFSWIISPIVKRIAPDLIITVETDFWLNFLKAGRKYGAKTVVVNGKISDKSFQRLKKFPGFSSILFSSIELFCVQNNIYQKRFLELNIPATSLYVTGNIKFDDTYHKLTPSELQAWRSEIGIASFDRTIVVGSSHHPEEMLILKQLIPLWSSFSNLKVIIVPRHPERFNEVATLITNLKLPFIRYSQLSNPNLNTKIILMDAMGLLRKCYQIAEIAIVAGSFTETVGGHNILEPSYFSVPVVFGPCMHQQPELAKLAVEYNSGIQLAGIENLQETINDLLTNPEKGIAIGQNGFRLTTEMVGATDRTLDLLQKYLRT